MVMQVAYSLLTWKPHMVLAIDQVPKRRTLPFQSCIYGWEQYLHTPSKNPTVSTTTLCVTFD